MGKAGYLGPKATVLISGVIDELEAPGCAGHVLGSYSCFRSIKTNEGPGSLKLSRNLQRLFLFLLLYMHPFNLL